MSDILLNKSKENLDLASSLFKSKKYINSIVHCSYYSSLQLIKYVIIFELHREESSLNAEAKIAKTGTNSLIISLIFKEMKERDKSDAVELHTAINELKQLRVDTDYGIDFYPDYSQLVKAKLKADIVNSIIKKYFKI
ncbi:MAG: HEPN domain-containing protein [Ignavibacteriae bacterium]|nr:HEPN domain-containing protein [Ignavibacteriota bacterium]